MIKPSAVDDRLFISSESLDEAIHKAFAADCLYLLNLFSEDTGGWNNYNVMVACGNVRCALDNLCERVRHVSFSRWPRWMCLIVIA